MTRRPTPPITSLDGLRKVRVGAARGTSIAERLATMIPAKNLDDAVPLGQTLAALKEGRIQAIVWGVEEAVIAARQDGDIELGMFVGPPESLAYAVRKGDAELLTHLNAYLSNMRRTATWNRLVLKYFGDHALAVLKRARGEE